MPLSKARKREKMRGYMRAKRAMLLPNSDKPISFYEGLNFPGNQRPVKPKSYSPISFESIADQVKMLYPDGKLPNCPDGRYR